MKKKKKTAKKIVVIAGILLLLFTIFSLAFPLKIIFKEEQSTETQKEKEEISYFYENLPNEGAIVMYLPAVDNRGEGVIIPLIVEAKKGKGRTLVDIDNLLFWVDTQHSIRTAKKVAKDITKINTSDYDFIYTIYANASIIGGGSAGAALAIATIAALQNKKLREDVIITGAINHDGTIGPVSSILAKAKAAKKHNATLFLVPLLQSREIIYETRKHCEKIGPAEFCTTEQIPKRINVSEEANITVVEVGSVEEALKYFIED